MQYSKMLILRNPKNPVLHTMWFNLMLLWLQIYAACGVVENACQIFLRKPTRVYNLEYNSTWFCAC